MGSKKVECFELCVLFFGGLRDKSVGSNNEDGGGLDCEVSEESLRILQRLYCITNAVF